MGYKIDHALTMYYGDCLWSIEDNDYSKLDWDASNSKSKPTLEDLQSKVTAMDAAEPMKRLRAKTLRSMLTYILAEKVKPQGPMKRLITDGKWLRALIQMFPLSRCLSSMESKHTKAVSM